MNKIFVFGSNLSGKHGKGAALYAYTNKGAIYGIGNGPMGQSYAIPTKDEYLKPLALHRINIYVQMFLEYARMHSELEFQVTPIGCGLAGYTPEQIAPMFVNVPSNCELPKEFTIYSKGA